MDGEVTEHEEIPEWRSGDIARAIGLKAATTSEHLQQLIRLGLITSRRDGNVVYYRLCNHELVIAFRELLNSLHNHYAQNLDNG